VLDTGIPTPERGRVFASRRRVRLADVDQHGRLRLDSIARFLQDAAIDDVEESGWGAPEHLWVVRRVRIDILAPCLVDTEVELTTWCSGVAAVGAGRRWSLRGDAGGRIEVDSVWIHLDAQGSPARIEDFGLYAEAANGRRVSTKLELPDPPGRAPRTHWALRTTDTDPNGHVNNSVYWQAVEQLLPALHVDPRAPLRADLDYREPIDVSEQVELATFAGEDSVAVGFVVNAESVRAVARVGATA
jgi:acyl-ACP thioesterase